MTRGKRAVYVVPEASASLLEARLRREPQSLRLLQLLNRAWALSQVDIVRQLRIGPKTVKRWMDDFQREGILQTEPNLRGRFFLARVPLALRHAIAEPMQQSDAEPAGAPSPL